jgi:hypothetical protein
MWGTEREHTRNSSSPSVGTPHPTTLQNHGRPELPVGRPYVKCSSRYSTPGRCHSADDELEEEGLGESGVGVGLEEGKRADDRGEPEN